MPKRPKPPFQKFRSDQHFTGEVLVDHYDATGRVVIAWGKLEAALEDLIWHFLDLSDEDGRTMTARLDARSKLQMLGVLANRYLSPQRRAEFGKLLTIIGDLQDERNFIVHGNWGTIFPENVPCAMSLRPKAPPGEIIAETFPEGRMKEIVAYIGQCGKHLALVRDALASSRHRQPKPFLA